MLSNNTSQVNKIITHSLAWCSLAMFALLLTDALGIFHFAAALKYAVKYLGLFTTLSPFVLYKLKVPDKVVMYYTLMIMSLFIGVMGTFTGIGIYISYVLVPVVSCLYFNKNLTRFICGFSYVCMCIAVWFNTGKRWEIKYLGYTHERTFLLYMIGFTIEYLIVLVFIIQLVTRAKMFMDEQHDALHKARAEEEKYKLLAAVSRDVIFEFDPATKHYSANRSLYADASTASEPLEIENLDKAVLEMDDKLVGIFQKLYSELQQTDFVAREIDASFERGGKKIPLWFQVEAYVIKDDDCDLGHVVGKFTNITTVKINTMSSQRDRLNDFYIMNSSGRSSLIKSLGNQILAFSEDDFRRMGQAHRVLANIAEELKDSQNLETDLPNALGIIAGLLGLDRIVILRGLNVGCYKAFEWLSKAGKPMIAEFASLTDSDIEACRRAYDQWGFLEFNVAHDVGDVSIKPDELSDESFNMLVRDALLGNQFWIPTLRNKEYTGAVVFDRYDTTLYTPSEKYIMAEAVNNIMAYIERADAEAASEAKTKYLSNMSHEIRTPMNAILGMSEVALRNEMSENIKQCILTIRSSAKGLLGIINDILDFSKIEAGKVDIVTEDYQTLSLINDVYTMAKARLGDKQLDLTFDVPEDLPLKLHGDVVRIKQIMVNLVTNAIKYTDKGSVVVSVDKDEMDGDSIVLKYSVKDTGMGIKEEELGTLFDVYSQVDVKKNHHKEGTGLGLSITKQLLELMDGKINVESTYGEGSVFSIVIPQKVVDPSWAGKLSDFKYEENFVEDISSFTAPDAKVLLVDDNDINIQVAIMLFSPLMMNITTAHDGAEAVELTKAGKYDLILMDHFMPIMDGGEAAKAIRADAANPNNNTPIIALTADAVSGVKEQLMADGMNDFIAKPINTSVAVAKIKKWLDKA